MEKRLETIKEQLDQESTQFLVKILERALKMIEDGKPQHAASFISGTIDILKRHLLEQTPTISEETIRNIVKQTLLKQYREN